MQRKSGLFEQIITYENLLIAYRKAYRGCNKSREAMKFNFNLEGELLRLRDEIKHRSYKPCGYRTFNIYDPKERTISVAPFRDRVVHHAIVNIIEPLFERIYIHDSYATRKNKGTHRAIKRVQEFLRKNEWYMRGDISKYFDSVNHEILIGILQRKIKDRDLLHLIELIIRNVPSDKGLPIGNLTSQFLANVYLDPLDHFIKDTLRVRYYVRYMDDIVLLSDNKELLKETLAKMRVFIKDRLALQFKERAVFINKRANGIGFLGVRIHPQLIRIKRESLKRGLNKLKLRQREYLEGRVSEESLSASESSIIGHIAFFNGHRLLCVNGQALKFWR